MMDECDRYLLQEGGSEHDVDAMASLGFEEARLRVGTLGIAGVVDVHCCYCTVISVPGWVFKPLYVAVTG
jgi:hypothetical protein